MEIDGNHPSWLDPHPPLHPRLLQVEVVKDSIAPKTSGNGAGRTVKVCESQWPIGNELLKWAAWLKKRPYSVYVILSSHKQYGVENYYIIMVPLRFKNTKGIRYHNVCLWKRTYKTKQIQTNSS